MKRRANGEGTVFEENDPRRATKYRAELDVRLPNGVIRRIVARGRTKAETRAALARKARLAEEQNPDAQRQTLEQFLTRWLDFKRPIVRASTIKTYERDAGAIRKALGHLPLASIRPGDVQGFITDLQARGLAAKADKCRRTLKQALKQAERWELLERSPARHVDPVRRPPPERGVWTQDQVDAFLEASRSSVYHPLFMLAIYSGLRRGELLALRWRDVSSSHVHVARTFSRDAAEGYHPPKTRAGDRYVPIASAVRAELGEEGEPEELVFRSRAGTAFGERNVNRALALLVQRANRDGARLPMIRFHDLRRTYATLLAAQGTHPRVIQKLLGHSTPDLAMTVYTDVLREQEEAARLEPSGRKSGGSASGTGVTLGLHKGRRYMAPGRLVER